MKRLFLLLVLAVSSLSFAGEGPKTGEAQALLMPRNDTVRTSLTGPAAKVIYDHLRQTYTPEGPGKCQVINAQGISCMADLSGKPYYACVFGVSKEGLSLEEPGNTYCVKTVGIGVGN